MSKFKFKASFPPCSICRDLKFEHISNVNPSINVLGDQFRITTTLNALTFRARYFDCPTCRLLVDGIAHYQSQEVVATNKAALDPTVHIKPCYCHALEVVLNPNGDSSMSIEFFSDLGVSHPWTTIGPESHIPHELWSLENKIQIQSWISFCSSDKAYVHAPCPERSIQRLPKRIIDVSGNESTIHLEEMEAVQGEYIALSHCWSTSTPLMIKKASLQIGSRTPIPYGALSPTIQQCVDLVRWLGIRWLWIDSICILQDDQSDWEEQSANMAAIYEQSYLTVALHLNDKQRTLPDHQVELKQSISDKDQLYSIYSRLTIHHPFMDRSETDQSARKDPMSTRAWCFQERLLAPRVLHCSPSEFVFECRGSYSCQCRYKPNHRPFFINYRQEFSKLDFNFDIDIWLSIISVYSAKQLTFDSDILPALAGVASKFSKEGGKYLAGVWENNLLFQLLWYSLPIDPDGNLPPRPRSLLAPSFSWASSTGAKDFMERNTAFRGKSYERRATVLSAECELASTNPWGHVKSGFLRISGPLLHARYNSKGRNVPHVSFQNFFCGGTLYEGWQYPAMMDWVDDTHLSDGTKISCLMLFRVDNDGFCYLLILQAEGAKSKKRYRRVGIFKAMLGDLPSFLDEELEEVEIF